jgi:uncharacterized protein (TIGR03437 family)
MLYTVLRGDNVSTKALHKLTLFAFASLAGAQVQLQFAPQNYQAPATYDRVVQLSGGNPLMVGSASVAGMAEGGIHSSTNPIYSTPNPHLQIQLSVPGPGGSFPNLSRDSGNDVPEAVAVDAKGNIWIAGITDADDFNLVNPIVSQKVAYRSAGFVMELDPTGSKLLFSTYLAGQQQSSSFPFNQYATTATAIALDSAGNVYVGGSTNEPDFPVTPGAYLTKGPGINSFMNFFYYSYVVKISPAGKLVYGTFLGTGTSSCVGGSTCLTEESTSADVQGLAVDSMGTVTAAGVQNGADSVESGYVSRLAPDGSKLLWTATIGASYGAIDRLTMALDASGNVDLLGRYAPVLAKPEDFSPVLGTTGLFAAKLSSDGSTVLYSTDLGQSADANPAGVALDASGNAYLAGTSSSPQFPTSPNVAGVPDVGADFVLRLDPTGAKPQTFFRFPLGVVSAPPAFDASGRLLLLSSPGGLLSLPPTYAFDTPAIVGFANAASYALDTGLSAGEIVTLWGFGLVQSASANAQVLIGNNPAPVFYAGPTQINIQVPFELNSMESSTSSPIQVAIPSGNLSMMTVSVDDPPVAQSVGIFTTDGVHAAALNQDGTVNSAANPAAAGSIVSIFGTGPNGTSGNVKDGAIATAPIQLYEGVFEMVDYKGTSASILYAGTAPGLSYGVFQVNAQLPPDFAPPFTLKMSLGSLGSVSSNAVQIYLP